MKGLFVFMTRREHYNCIGSVYIEKLIIHVPNAIKCRWGVFPNGVSALVLQNPDERIL